MAVAPVMSRMASEMVRTMLASSTSVASSCTTQDHSQEFSNKAESRPGRAHASGTSEWLPGRDSV